MIRRVPIAAVAAILLAAIPPCFAAPAAGSEPTVEQILDGVDDAARGTSSRARVTMHVKTERWDRSMTMDIWSRGEDRSLIRIVEPAKEAGMATLRVADNIWNYLPKVDRTMKVPASMMSGSWMGSHFSNDDLVKGSRMADDYTWQVTERPQGGAGRYVVELVPKPEAPVVWGKVVVAVRPDLVPLEIGYWDEHGALARTMTFDDVREVAQGGQGRLVPFRMRLVPAGKEQEFTEIAYETLEFDVAMDESLFSVAALKR